jgi:hypothetical protein
MEASRMLKHARVTTLLLACALALPLMNAGCAEHRYARVYDPSYRDYHRWSPDEGARYHRWETENHMEHREWAQRDSKEQNEYWAWRHGQAGHDRDRH